VNPAAFPEIFPETCEPLIAIDEQEKLPDGDTKVRV
jgi:hypothetical protein